MLICGVNDLKLNKMDKEKKEEALEILGKIFHVAKGAEITYIENKVLEVFEIINSTQEVELEENIVLHGTQDEALLDVLINTYLND